MVQMVGRLPSKEEIAGSIPAGSTSLVHTGGDAGWTRPRSPLVQLAEQGTVNAHVARSSRARGATVGLMASVGPIEHDAGVVQRLGRHLVKVEVAGSNPVARAPDSGARRTVRRCAL